MGFTLDNVVPWGRSHQEYVNMFALSEPDLRRRLLGCGDGPAAFNSELTKRGGNIVSFDPVYAFSAAQIKKRITETYETVMEQLRRNQKDYVWTSFSSVEEVGRVRMSAMENFLADFDAGKAAGRYIAGELPFLPFKDGEFSLALSSHFLFLYSAYLSAEFHLRALREMLRTAREVRVFPILTLDGKPSPHLDFVMEQLENQGYTTDIKTVPYEFQRGGNEMLLITPQRGAGVRVRGTAGN